MYRRMSRLVSQTLHKPVLNPPRSQVSCLVLDNPHPPFYNFSLDIRTDTISCDESLGFNSNGTVAVSWDDSFIMCRLDLGTI